MNRIYSIDLMRILSMAAIIMIHVVTAPIANTATAIDISLKNNLNMVHALMLWSVPIFFMITGYCLLKKESCTYPYCFSHVLKYVAVLFTVGLFYALLEEVFNTKLFNSTTVIHSIQNVLSGNLWDHMWFIYSIIGVYLVMPVIHNFMQQGNRNILILTSLLFIFTILVPAFDKWIPIRADFPFGGYLFYVCFGGTVAKLDVKKKFLYLGGLAVIVAVICLCIFKQTLEYKHPIVCIMAMGIFLIICHLKIKASPLLLHISAYSWGIYLIHPFFINLILKALKINLLSSMPYFRLLVFYTVVFIMSFCITAVLRRIPLIKKLF